MAAYVIDDKNPSYYVADANGTLVASKAMRVIGYENKDTDLTGAVIDTVNKGKVECEPFSLAFKKGMTDMVSLGTDNSWG